MRPTIGCVFDLLMFLVVVAAAARITRLVVTDTITEPARAWLLPRIARSRFERTRISHGMDASPPTRIRGFVLDMLQCPWCIGFWISAALIGAASLASGVWVDITGHWWADLPIAALAVSYLVGWLADQEAP